MGDEEEEEDLPPIKMLVVGDGAVGKTCLLMRYTQNKFPTNYVPTVFENITKVVSVKLNENDDKETKVSLDLWDTAGQEEFDRMRHLSYPDTDVFLMCFSVVSPTSFENVSTKWIPDIEHHMKDKDYRLLLVGLKCDLREDERELNKLKETGKKPVEMTEIEALQKRINAIGYVECSALTAKNVHLCFEKSIKHFLSSSEPDATESGGGCSVCYAHTHTSLWTVRIYECCSDISYCVWLCICMYVRMCVCVLQCMIL